jgi:uncharacterized protein YjbI with pentapeptide repeats
MEAEEVTVEVVLSAYAGGQRLFSQLDLPDGSDLSGCCLEGATFHECFISSASLNGANLKGTTFRSCNLKCTDFDDADLTGACIENCSMECVSARRCSIGGLQVRNCSFQSSADYGLEDFIRAAVCDGEK